MTRSLASATESTAVDQSRGTATLEGDARQHGRVLSLGCRIGRHIVRRRLGVGGMGEVFAALDTELDREVALKLIHERQHAGNDDTNWECERLRQEAQALARLSHPNVVQIYEVGLHGEHTYLAMELVAGPTLATWKPSSLAELLDVYTQAGRGLAAAHAVGLAHRDFKPSNVIVGDDGRVRVLDFGLAKPAQMVIESSTTIGDESDDPRPRASSSIGGPGTLPYMAPEQAFCGTGGPAGDQFSFCVALFEAIYGARPFPARTVMELLAKLDTCALEFPRVGVFGSVPRWLRKLLARGLARNPSDRFPSMDLLLAELGRDRRRVWQRVGFAAAVSGLTALVMLALAPDRERAGIEAPAPDLAGVWDNERREALAQAFTHVHESWADGSEDAVLAGLDAWSSRWIAEADMALRTRDPLRRRAVEACLDSQRTQADITIAALLEGDAALLEGAVVAVDALPEPSRCSATPDLALAVIDPAVLMPELRMLADAAAQRTLGRPELAREQADAVLRNAQAMGASGGTSLELAALRQRGLANIEAGAREAGLVDLEQARNLAVRNADHASAAELVVDLAWASRKLDNAALRRDRLALAQAYVDGLPQDAGQARHVLLLGARVELALALEQLREGEQLVAAERSLLAGLDTLASIDAEASLLAIDYLHALARVRESAGQLEQAELDYQLALARAEQVRGHAHPSNARVWYDAGALAHQRGELELARERMTHARDLRAAALRVDHPELARSELGLAQIEYSDGELERARVHAERALQVFASGGDRAELGETLRLLGQLEVELLHWDAGVAHYERALPLTTGIQHSLVELELGKALLQLGQAQRGVELIEASLPRIAAALGSNCAQLIPTYERHADALTALGEHARARVSLTAALACTDDEDTRARLLGRVQTPTQ